MLDFHSKMKKSIFSARMQSKILRLVFQGYYNLAPTHFSILLDYYLLIQTLWSSQTDVLIIPHTYYVHSNPPSCVLFILIPLPWILSPFILPKVPSLFFTLISFHFFLKPFFTNSAMCWLSPLWAICPTILLVVKCEPPSPAVVKLVTVCTSNQVSSTPSSWHIPP